MGGPVDDIVDDSVGRGEGVGQAKEVQGLTQGQIVMARFSATAAPWRAW